MFTCLMVVSLSWLFLIERTPREADGDGEDGDCGGECHQQTTTQHRLHRGKHAA